MCKRLYFLIATFVLMVSAAVAQVTTSGMSGKITANNEVVVGAAVEAIHTPSGTRYVGVTNAKGMFYIQGMRAGGPYKVKISYMGYETQEVNDLQLQLGENFNLSTSLSEKDNKLGEVVVRGSKSKFSAQKTGAATNISNLQMQALPTISRSITDVTRLSPYGGNGMTFSGTDGRTANFTVDGANFNNNFGLNDGLPGGGNPISLDAIEELQVVVSPYDVRQSNFIGGGVNAITKSGTNTFKGTAYVYHRNENMRGDAVEGEQIPGYRDTDRNTMYGFTLGGPLVKNKLFFFVNGEYTQTPSTAIRWRASENGVGNSDQYLSYCTIGDMQRVSDFVKEKYGYNTGSWTDFPADQNNYKVLARLDWNINNNNKLALRYNHTNNTRWSAPNASSMDGGTRSAFGRTSLYSMAFANSMYSQNNLVHSASLDLNSRITDQLSNQFLATFSKLDDVRGSNSDPFPFIDIMDGTGTTTQYMALGYELFTHNNAVHNTVFNVKNDLTYITGNHKIFGGVSYEYQLADNAYMRNGTGYYRYNSVDDFLNGATPEVVCLTYGYDGETNPAARVRFHRPSIYAQDDWTVSDRFKLTYGLRLDGLFFDNQDLMTNNAIYALNYGTAHDAANPDAHVDGCRHIDTGKWPGGSVSVSPRVGFNWDILGDNSLKLRGGTGLFSGRLPLVFFTNMPTNSGMVQYQAQLNSKNTDMTVFNGGLVCDANGKPTIDALKDKIVNELGHPNTITPEDGALPSSISAVDPSFKMPQVWKTSLALDYTFPVAFPFTLSAEGIFNKTVNGVTISDWSMMPVEGFTHFNGADARPIFPGNFRQGKKAFVLENTSKGYGWSANVTLNMKPIESLSLMVAYTHTVAKELTGMPGSNAESAFTYVPTVNGPNNIGLHSSEYVTPDRFVLSATHHDKCGNHFSLIYEAFRGGYNYSYMMVNDMNGDGYNYDALYIPTDQEVESGAFRFKTPGDKTRFMDYVHNNPYLNKNQGKYAEAYAEYSPWVHRVDFSYKHDFKIKAPRSTHKLQLSFDVKNLLNLFNDKWGVMKQMNPTLNGGRILKYEGTDGEGFPVFSTPSAVSANTQTWTRNHAIGQCWYASIGLKYIFN